MWRKDVVQLNTFDEKKNTKQTNKQKNLLIINPRLIKGMKFASKKNSSLLFLLTEEQSSPPLTVCSNPPQTKPILPLHL